MLHKGICKILPEPSEFVHEWSEVLHERLYRIHEQNTPDNLWFLTVL